MINKIQIHIEPPLGKKSEKNQKGSTHTKFPQKKHAASQFKLIAL